MYLHQKTMHLHCICIVKKRRALHLHLCFLIKTLILNNLQRYICITFVLHLNYTCNTLVIQMYKSTH